jgi:hypothetical protein
MGDPTANQAAKPLKNGNKYIYKYNHQFRNSK